MFIILSFNGFKISELSTKPEGSDMKEKFNRN